jgi:hypothetical protein
LYAMLIDCCIMELCIMYLVFRDTEVVLCMILVPLKRVDSLNHYLNIR